MWDSVIMICEQLLAKTVFLDTTSKQCKRRDIISPSENREICVYYAKNAEKYLALQKAILKRLDVWQKIVVYSPKSINASRLSLCCRILLNLARSWLVAARFLFLSFHKKSLDKWRIVSHCSCKCQVMLCYLRRPISGHESQQVAKSAMMLLLSCGVMETRGKPQ